MSKTETARERKAREKAFRKESQKIAIKGIGQSSNQEKEANKDRLKTKGKEEISIASTTIEKANGSLQESVKGQFGNKVSEVFEQEKTMLSNF